MSGRRLRCSGCGQAKNDYSHKMVSMDASQRLCKECEQSAGGNSPSPAMEQARPTTAPIQPVSTQQPRSLAAPQQPQKAFAARKEPPVVEKVRDILIRRSGGGGYRGLVRILRKMDTNGNKQLDRDELYYGMMTYGVKLNKEELGNLMKFFDRSGDGQIDITEFCVALRPGMNAKRTGFVRQVFDRMDMNCDGSLTFDELMQFYRADRHPAVLKGEKTVEEVFQDFTRVWDKDGDSITTANEFLEYYEEISSQIDDDDYFELMIRNCWHLAGGTGASANTTCLRLAVKHSDGSVEIVCLENDLGVDKSNVQEVIQRLNMQGVQDIVAIDMSGKI